MDTNIAFLMFDASRNFRREIDAVTRDFGVTSHQWRLLGIVSRNPGINQCEAADMLDVEPITLSRMVDKLEAAEMIERRSAPNDRRAWCLYTTDAAKPMIEKIRSVFKEVLDQCLDGFAPDELRAFTQFLERYRANLDEKPLPHGRYAEPQSA